MTLFVNKAPIEPGRHADLTWGAAQAGVAAGVAEAVADGIVDRDRAGELLVIAAVWVNPAAEDEDAVFANNREATLDGAAQRAGRRAARRGRAGGAVRPLEPLLPRALTATDSR